MILESTNTKEVSNCDKQFLDIDKQFNQKFC